MRGRALTALAVTTVIAGMSGCRAIVEPGTLENTVGVIVSAPVHPGAAIAAAPGRAFAASAAGLRVVYVSLPPGSVPTGVRATIADQALCPNQSLAPEASDRGQADSCLQQCL